MAQGPVEGQGKSVTWGSFRSPCRRPDAHVQRRCCTRPRSRLLVLSPSWEQLGTEESTSPSGFPGSIATALQSTG
ncbi:Hypothetical predicted protein [Marmota monax]|uniref:Uncharacterized protein n=1 Tax=Marmota monax TaxID=9995 RepID=A0A5E4CKT2_MARMO|nr:hypothetical protein GHT09_018356 [Marmota monax]VTJ81910.1 Hypothetical predicted protein [Marmota monax]